MIPGHGVDPNDPMDAAQRESTEYWNGYYQGKAAAMRNLGAIHRINLDQARRRLRRSTAVVAGIDLAIAATGAWTTWPGVLDRPSIWIRLAVGFVFGSWAGTRLHWWRHG